MRARKAKLAMPIAIAMMHPTPASQYCHQYLMIVPPDYRQRRLASSGEETLMEPRMIKTDITSATNRKTTINVHPDGSGGFMSAPPTSGSLAQETR